MIDQRLVKLADLLVNYSVEVKPGQKVLIQGSVLAEALIKEVYIKVLEAGGHPINMISFREQDYTFFTHANEDQLKFIHEPVKYMYENYDARIYIMGGENTRSLTNIDPDIATIRHKATGSLLNTMLRRFSAGEFRWTLAMCPNSANAQEASMSMEEYENFVFNASMPNLDNPVRFWKEFSKKNRRIIDWLKGKKEVHITGIETDLKLRIDDRPFINCDCHENVPDGEVFTSPIENSAQGHIYFSYPAIYDGHEVSGIRLWFEKGKVVKATAEKNEEYLNKVLDTDNGSRFLGEFAFGLNPGITQFTGEILFDEKINGSVHLAVGTGFPESKSENESAVHWDMICDLRHGGAVEIDGQLIYSNGDFTIDF